MNTKLLFPGLLIGLALISSCRKEIKETSPGAPAEALSGMAATPQVAGTSQVYLGGYRSYAGIVQGDPAQSSYVRANADGWYINNFGMAADQSAAFCQAAYDRYAHKNVFYETDFSHATEAEDQANIDRFITAGFRVTYATLNRDYTPQRKYVLQHRDPNRPVLRMVAPWQVYGNFYDSRNADLQWDIRNCQGSSTDGPMTLWSANTGNMRIRVINGEGHAGGSATLVQWTKAQNPNFSTMVMMAPNESSGAEFLARVQDCVRMHERFNASPGIYVISFYGPATFTCPVLPEQVNGQPAPTIAGAAYWLIKHLRGELP